MMYRIGSLGPDSSMGSHGTAAIVSGTYLVDVPSGTIILEFLVHFPPAYLEIN